MAHSVKWLNSLSQNNSCLDLWSNHMNNSNKHLTQRHTGLSGARRKLNHQTASVRLAPKQRMVSLNTNHVTSNKSNPIRHPISHQPKWQKASPWKHQRRSSAFNHIIWAIAATQDLILKFNCAPETNFFLYQHQSQWRTVESNSTVCPRTTRA